MFTMMLHFNNNNKDFFHPKINQKCNIEIKITV